MEEIWRSIRAAQERRARAYSEWDKAFKSAFAARSTPSDFQAVAGVVTSELGAVTAELRRLQEEARSNARPGEECGPARVVDDLQAAEKARYEATIELQRSTAVHANIGVMHDPDCFVVGLHPAVRCGIGSSGLDASDSDEDGACNEGQDGHDHAHGRHCDHADAEPHAGTRKGNGCRELERKRVELIEAIRAATTVVQSCMEEVQCELSN